MIIRPEILRLNRRLTTPLHRNDAKVLVGVLFEACLLASNVTLF